MKEFICAKCGGKSYSSAAVEYQKDPSCPYCGYLPLVDNEATNG